MFAQNLSDRLAAKGVHYAWVVAGVTFLTMLATAGAMGSAGVLIGPLQAEFGWTKAEISSALAVRMLLFGLLGPFAAAMMNSFGLRSIVALALGLIVTGIAGSFFMQRLWQLVLLWGVILGTGTGMTALVLGATVATRWFSARRGLVMGMMTASNATGQLVFLPMFALVTEAYGWRMALSVILAVLALAFGMVALLLRDHPSDLGLPAYGDSEISRPAKPDRRLLSLLTTPLRVLVEMSRSATFWVLFGTFFVCGLSTNGLIQTHWVSICGDFGILPVAAAGLLALIGVFDMVGTISSGWLSDRYDNRWLLFWFYCLRGLSLVFLSLSGFGIYAISIFAVFYGMDWVATVPPTVKLTAERFGRDKANLAFGWIFAGHQIGAATAAYGAGAIRDDLLTYMPALQVAGMMCVIAALAVLSLQKPGVAVGRAAKPSPAT